MIFIEYHLYTPALYIDVGFNLAIWQVPSYILLNTQPYELNHRQAVPLSQFQRVHTLPFKHITQSTQR